MRHEMPNKILQVTVLNAPLFESCYNSKQSFSAVVFVTFRPAPENNVWGCLVQREIMKNVIQIFCILNLILCSPAYSFELDPYVSG